MTPEGRRFLDASGQGYRAGTIGSRDVTAAQMGQGLSLGGPSLYSPDQIRAINAARGVDIRAQEVGAGAVGNTLLGRALTMSNSDGTLTAQGARDAIQSARQGFAARGMATSNSSLGAELLNREKFSRQRMFQDLNFARQVQVDDTDRQIRNAANILQGDIANQSTATNLSLADQRAAMDAQANNQLANQKANEYFQTEEGRRMMANQTDLTNRDSSNMQQLNFINAGNADRALTGATANENAQRLGTLTNNESLFNAAGYVDGRAAASLGASLQMAGVQQAANPLMRAIAFDPYGTRGAGSQALPVAGNLAGGVANNNAQIGTFNAGQANDFALANWNAQNWLNAANFQPSFNSGGGNGGNWLTSGLAGGLGGAALGFQTAGPTGAVIGGVGGFGLGAASSQIG
jgi:hypothetical protein